jgi:hypothetical protein
MVPTFRLVVVVAVGAAAELTVADVCPLPSSSIGMDRTLTTLPPPAVDDDDDGDDGTLLLPGFFLPNSPPPKVANLAPTSPLPANGGGT